MRPTPYKFTFQGPAISLATGYNGDGLVFSDVNLSLLRVNRQMNQEARQIFVDNVDLSITVTHEEDILESFFDLPPVRALRSGSLYSQLRRLGLHFNDKVLDPDDDSDGDSDKVGKIRNGVLEFAQDVAAMPNLKRAYLELRT